MSTKATTKSPVSTAPAVDILTPTALKGADKSQTIAHMRSIRDGFAHADSTYAKVSGILAYNAAALLAHAVASDMVGEAGVWATRKHFTDALGKSQAYGTLLTRGGHAQAQGVKVESPLWAGLVQHYGDKRVGALTKETGKAYRDALRTTLATIADERAAKAKGDDKRAPRPASESDNGGEETTESATATAKPAAPTTPGDIAHMLHGLRATVRSMTAEQQAEVAATLRKFADEVADFATPRTKAGDKVAAKKVAAKKAVAPVAVAV